MRKGKSIIFTILTMFIFLSAKGQEVLLPLKCNTQLFYNRTMYTSPKTINRGVESVLFFDDFYYCYKSKFPDPTKWIPNNQVYVNNNFPINPPSIGVATLDGLNALGMPYDTSNSNTFSQPADTLTSQPINLSSFTAPVDSTDSIYLSFFYQPQGYGDYPNAGDSLVLEFAQRYPVTDSSFYKDSVIVYDKIQIPDTVILADSMGVYDSVIFLNAIVRIDSVYYDTTKKYYVTADTSIWFHVWATDGYSGPPGLPFQQVMIPVDSAVFFENNFQFRFRNYASTTGDNDQWNIDYVKLGFPRTISDTVLNDEAIQKYSTSILSNYQQMPWNQFKANPSGELSTGFNAYVRNNFDSTENDAYDYTAEEITNSILLSHPAPFTFNFPAMSNDSNEYSMYSITPLLSLDTIPIIKTTFTSGTTSEFSTLTKHNDTLVQYQYFPYYYAYDDGSAEKSYGLLGIGARGALRFHLNTPDTLQAVQIHFEHLIEDQSNDLLSIIVWKSLNPEVILYEKDFLHPSYIDTLNGFATYLIDTPCTYIADTPLVVSDTIYVGWLQSQQDILDMGFDRNTNSQSNLFYNLNPTPGTPWTNSSFPGSLMLHPVLGSRAELRLGTSNIVKKDNIKIYPNPVENELRIANLTYDTQYAVYSILGSEVMQGRTNNGEVDVSALNDGIYFIRLLLNQNQQQNVYKFIKD